MRALFVAGLRAVPALAALALLAAGATLRAERSGQADSASAGGNAGHANADSRATSGPRLAFGTPLRTGKTEAEIPMTFTPADYETVGEIEAEIVVPAGPWKLNRAQPPKGSNLRANLKELPRSAETLGASVFRLRISGRPEIAAGGVGALHFKLDKADSPLPKAPAVRTLQTLNPDVADALDPPPRDPPANPAPTCFFFTH